MLFRSEIIILDKVVEECKFIAKGIVIEKLQYLSSKKFQVKTDELLPTQRFFNQLENQFINGSIRNKLTPIEFENRKDSFLNSADSKLILYSLKNKNDILSKLFIVTEETEFSNDNKAFKKLPAICKILEIDVLTLPKLLELYEGIDLAIINQ